MAEVFVGDGVFVPVGEDLGITATVLVMAGKVSCADEGGFTATVGVRDGEAARAIVDVEIVFSLGDNAVDVCDSDAGIAV